MKLNEIYIGDCRDVMRGMPDNSVNCIVTSPPYFGLRDYGVDGQIGNEPTPLDFVEAMVEVFREARRILADDGTVWLNLGDTYNGNKKGNTETNKNKRLVDSKHEKKMWTELKNKDLIGIPWRVAFALQADGWYLRQDIVWNKPNAMPDGAKDRCTKSHEYIFMLTKKPKYYFDAEAIQEPTVQDANEFKNKRSVWTVTTKPFKGAHFATFPKDLIEPCVRAGCPRSGVVFDPFMGAGTTAVVALENGRNFVGAELNPEYREIALKRIKQTPFQSRMFTQNQ